MRELPDIVLFDMDGTLAPEQTPISDGMADRLIALLEHADIGIVTGREFQYLQLHFDRLRIREELLKANNAFWLFPCNGTQVYLLNPKTRNWELMASTQIRDKIGTRWLNYLYMEIFEAQNRLMLRETDLPFSPPFIQERPGIVNWSLIGQSADANMQAAFEAFDTDTDFRESKIRMLERLQTSGDIHPYLVFKLGGKTSIDIFPKGWDKSRVLDNFKNQRVWFVGDDCAGSGNDKEIYAALAETGRAFETTGPLDTEKIINTKIIPGVQNDKV